MKWLLVWGFLEGGGFRLGAPKPSVSQNLGFIPSAEGWYLNLGWHHISGNSSNVNAREGVANGETSNGFLQQYGRTGSM